MKIGPGLKSVAAAIAAGFALGVLIELPALAAAIISGGAGHGDYAAARVLFPWSMLLTLLEGRIGAFSMGVGLLQFPIYGGLLGWSISQRLYLPAVVGMSAHFVAALVCFTGVLPYFS